MKQLLLGYGRERGHYSLSNRPTPPLFGTNSLLSLCARTAQLWSIKLLFGSNGVHKRQLSIGQWNILTVQAQERLSQDYPGGYSKIPVHAVQASDLRTSDPSDSLYSPNITQLSDAENYIFERATRLDPSSRFRTVSPPSSEPLREGRIPVVEENVYIICRGYRILKKNADRADYVVIDPQDEDGLLFITSAEYAHWSGIAAKLDKKLTVLYRPGEPRVTKSNSPPKCPSAARSVLRKRLYPFSVTRLARVAIWGFESFFPEWLYPTFKSVTASFHGKFEPLSPKAKPESARHFVTRSAKILVAHLLLEMDRSRWEPSIRFWMFFLVLWNNNGLPHAVLYFKEAKRLLMKYCAHDDMVKKFTLIHCIPCGIPSCIPVSFRIRILKGDTDCISWVLFLLDLPKCFPYVGTPKLETITAPGPSTVEPTIEEFDRTYGSIWYNTLGSVVHDMLKIPSLKWKCWYASSVMGPNGHATVTCHWDAVALVASTDTWKVFQDLAKEWGSTSLVQHITLINELTMKIATSFKEASSILPKVYVGKLTRLYEAFGKVRIIAIPCYFIQNLLRPLHDEIFRILKSIPNDFTFDQKAGVDAARASGAKELWSLDLSSATDRAPVRLQSVVLSWASEQFTQVRTGFDLWAKLFSTIPFTYTPPGAKKGEKASVNYKVGQPMGSYSSWAAFTLMHHAIVQWAHYRVTGNQCWFRDYALLGDDIIFWELSGITHLVVAEYELILEKLGVSVNRAKGFHSTNGSFEFAKVLVTHDKVVTQFYWKEWFVSGISSGFVCLMKYLKRLQARKGHVVIPVAMLLRVILPLVHTSRSVMMSEYQLFCRLPLNGIPLMKGMLFKLYVLLTSPVGPYRRSVQHWLDPLLTQMGLRPVSPAGETQQADVLASSSDPLLSTEHSSTKEVSETYFPVPGKMIPIGAILSLLCAVRLTKRMEKAWAPRFPSQILEPTFSWLIGEAKNSSEKSELSILDYVRTRSDELNRAVGKLLRVHPIPQHTHAVGLRVKALCLSAGAAVKKGMRVLDHPVSRWVGIRLIMNNTRLRKHPGQTHLNKKWGLPPIRPIYFWSDHYRELLGIMPKSEAYNFSVADFMLLVGQGLGRWKTASEWPVKSLGAALATLLQNAIPSFADVTIRSTPSSDSSDLDVIEAPLFILTLFDTIVSFCRKDKPIPWHWVMSLYRFQGHPLTLRNYMQKKLSVPQDGGIPPSPADLSPRVPIYRDLPSRLGGNELLTHFLGENPVSYLDGGVATWCVLEDRDKTPIYLDTTSPDIAQDQEGGDPVVTVSGKALSI